MIPVIMSGGSGTRLWPVSRASFPKQFCNLFEDSLHSLTLSRISSFGTPWVITSATLRDLTLKNMMELGASKKNLLIEPFAKNTAPAIALMVAHFTNQGKHDEIVGVFPADHLIEKENAFKDAVTEGIKCAQNDQIVTLGIQPHFPATGYGYIQIQNNNETKIDELQSYSVQGFHEKPNRETAMEYIQSGNYFWNAGIFIFKVSTMLKHFKSHQPDLHASMQKLKSDLSNLEAIYNEVKNISIDYAIMEKLTPQELSCVPCDIGWNDIGSWDAIAEILSTNTKNNVIEYNSRNNFVQSMGDKNYSFIGVEDLIVVDTKDALLISKKGASQNVKDIVDILKSKNPALIDSHPEL